MPLSIIGRLKQARAEIHQTHTLVGELVEMLKRKPVPEVGHPSAKGILPQLKVNRDGMVLPPGTEMVEFRCNLCGAKNRISARGFHRELAACTGCGANARFRGIVHALSLGLFGKSLPLTEFPIDKSIRGLGMSDSVTYAGPLEERFCYVNTFFDTEPSLDITSDEWKHYAERDFIISTDVFEHVRLPLQPAFDNLYRTLRPGGTLIFSVPYTAAPATIEHFPALHRYEIFNFNGRRILVNETVDGAFQVYDRPVFHGGDGATLELRVFSQNDVIAYLLMAGFTDIVVHDTAVPDIGYYWPPMAERLSELGFPFLAYIISARKAA